VQILQPLVKAGDLVRARGQQWLVSGVSMFDACTLITLRGSGSDNRGDESHLLIPFDRVDPVKVVRSVRRVPAHRWRRRAVDLVVRTGHAGTLRTAGTARITLLPHQLEPALAIVNGAGSRVLLADDVGLGKTVQAGLIVSELIARGAAKRVLILAPAGLRDQWVEECRQRFGLELRVFDAWSIRQYRRVLPASVNPWTTQPLIVASMDYVKRPEVLVAVRACHWDVAVVDEAHHAAIGSDRHDAVAAICGSASYVALLTATPHNGDARAFASICGIGQRHDRLIVFRRTRQDIGGPNDRRVHRLRVGTSEAERRMHACLAAFVRAVAAGHRRGSGAGREPMEPAVALAVATLRKRALSSPFALARSVDRRLRALAGESEDTFEQLTLPLGDAGAVEGLDAADEPPGWTLPALADATTERTLLTRLLESATTALADESKVRALARLLRRLAEPALIFTEYRDTLLHVRDRIAPDAAIIHGGLSSEERRRSLERFSRGAILLATDAGGEGLNLQVRCRVVINLELPWSPVRLEQRIGRVDRIGQSRRVHVFHLIAAGSGEGGMLERLAGRIARATSDIAAPNPLESTRTVRGPGEVPFASSQVGDEAAEELERLEQLRRLTAAVPGPKREITGGDACTFVTRTRRSGMRRHLQGRTLVVMRCALVDRTGRVAAVHLTSLLMRLDSGRRFTLDDLTAIEWIIGAASEVDAGTTQTDQWRSAWIARSLVAHRAFWRTRLARERALAPSRPAHREAVHQRGLFDRRADRDLHLEDQTRRTARQEAAQRLRMCRGAAHLEALPIQALLVLQP
jgi:superfamily II DNA or RNA helicase